MKEEDKIRDKILSGAKEQFQRFGLKKTTMDDIARSIGMGKSSIYYYFKSKDEIFDRVLDDEMLKLRYTVDSEVQKQDNLENKLISYATTYFKELIPRQTLYRIVNQEENEVGSKTRLKRIINVEVKYLKLLLTNYLKNINSINLNNTQLQLFAEAVISSIYGVIHYSFVINDDMNEQKFGEMMTMMMPRLI